MTRKRTRREKPRNPNAPTGLPTAADAEHTAKVEAAKACRAAEDEVRARIEREREDARLAAMTPQQRAREREGRDVARRLVTLAAVMGGLAR